jgi:hypothetical protein
VSYTLAFALKLRKKQVKTIKKACIGNFKSVVNGRVHVCEILLQNKENCKVTYKLLKVALGMRHLSDQ